MQLRAFEVGSPIGRGGMGEILAGRHRRSGLPVAIKVLLESTPATRRGFAVEVEAVASLEHPYVVRILDHGVQGGMPWLAMPRAEGTLTSLVGAPWPEVRAAMLLLLDGLAHAHARGVIHRDLKPSNVLVGCRLDPTAPLAHPLDGLAIADFGIAHAIGSALRGRSCVASRRHSPVPSGPS